MGQLERGYASVIDNMISNPTPSFAAGVIGKLGTTALGVKGFKGTRDYATAPAIVPCCATLPEG